jgi:hypothetical protein
MRSKLENQLRHIRKQQKEFSYDGFMTEMRNAFFHHLSFLPQEMLYELFHYFLESYTEGKDPYKDFDRLSEKLLDITDLFNGNYNDSVGSISDREIDYIKEAVNDFALQIDDDTVFYIMQKAMERGSFHR